MTLEEVAEHITRDGPRAHRIAKKYGSGFNKATLLDPQDFAFIASFNKILQDCLIVVAFYEDLFEAGVVPTPSQTKAMDETIEFLKKNGYYV